MSAPPLASIVNSSLAAVGTVVGLVLAIVPEFNKPLVIALALFALAAFAPFRKMNTEAEGVVEVVRYLCLGWAVLVVAQQTAKLQFVRAAPVAISKSTLDFVADERRGALPDMAIVRLKRSPHFDQPGSYLIQPISKTSAVSLPIAPVIERAARQQAKGAEGVLLIFAAAGILMALALRFVARILAALAPAAQT